MHMSKVGNFENDDGVYKTLLESTQAIPWKIDWATMKFTYIGPQIEALLGWRTDDWGTVQDWIDRGDLQERPDGTRNPLQTVPLVETIAEVGYNAVLGGARRGGPAAGRVVVAEQLRFLHAVVGSAPVRTRRGCRRRRRGGRSRACSARRG